MTRFKLIIILIFAIMIVNCTGILDVVTSPILSCSTKKVEIDSHDWSKSDVINLEIENNEFYPSLIQLKKDKTYVLSVYNKDPERKWFVSNTFFKNSLVGKIIVNNEEIDEPCPINFAVYPRKYSRVYLIPLKAGQFDFEIQKPIIRALSLIWDKKVNIIFVDR